jgi:hypothetical protein
MLPQYYKSACSGKFSLVIKREGAKLVRRSRFSAQVDHHIFFAEKPGGFYNIIALAAFDASQIPECVAVQAVIQ